MIILINYSYYYILGITQDYLYNLGYNFGNLKLCLFLFK